VFDENGERTTVNVKGVLERSWERTKVAAQRRGETLGLWMSRAVEMQADREEGMSIADLMAPVVGALTSEQLTARQLSTAALLQGVAAMKASTGKATGKATVSLALASLEQRMIETEGAPAPRLRGKSLVKKPAVEWQPETVTEC
jgi:hypothetical protein